MELPQLPPEIQAYIFAQDAALLRLSQRLSSGVMRGIMPAYQAQFCSTPISQHELQEYIATQPKRFIHFFYVRDRGLPLSENLYDTMYADYFAKANDVYLWYVNVSGITITGELPNNEYQADVGVSIEGGIDGRMISLLLQEINQLV